MWQFAAGAALALFSGIGAQRAAADEADRRREAEMLSAMYQYSAAESAIKLMKSTLEASTLNATYEALREGGAQQREVSKEIDKAVSTQVAASEGLTSGRSAGRQIATTLVKGSKAIQETQQQTANMISQLVDYKDSKTNELNNKLIESYNSMYSVLTTPGDIYRGSNAEIVASMFKGAATGAKLASSFGSFGGGGGIASAASAAG
jgi:hypothetical protein